MPSGAKKRKAAKKKLQKAHKNGAHPQGNDDARSHDERDSDVEREHSEEGSVENHEEGGKEVSLGDENAAQTAEEVEGEDKSNDVNVEAEEDAAGEPQNGDASVEHKSSSCSSGSDDEEVAVEKEKTEPVVLESSVEVEQQEVESSPPEVVVSEEKTEPVANESEEPVVNESEAVSTENSEPSEEVRDVTEESIPVEESVKEVVTSPPESNVETESVPAEETTVSETIVDELKQKVEELLPSSVDKDQISSTVTGFLENIQTKATQVVERSPVDKDQISSTVTGFLGNIQTKATQVVERGLENLPTPFNGTATENEALLPQSSGVTTAERNGGSHHVKESEKQKCSDEQPLVSSAPLPVQRTSWMNCCGLLEVFSGGASR